MIGTEGWIRLVKENQEPRSSINLSNYVRNIVCLFFVSYETCVPKPSSNNNSKEFISNETSASITLLQHISFQQLNSVPQNSNSAFNRQKKSVITYADKSETPANVSLLQEIFRKQQKIESEMLAKNRRDATQVRHSLSGFSKI